MSNDSISETPMRRCTTCKVEFPATLEYFNRLKAGKYGLRPICRECQKAEGREWYQNNTERSKAKTVRWQAANPDKVRLYSHNNHAKNRERRNAESREYRRTHLDLFNEHRRKFQQNNPEYIRRASQLRRAKKRDLTNTFTVQQWEDCQRYWHGCCAYCGAQQDFWHIIEQDHFIPLTASGGYTASNIVPACKTCNVSKKNRPAADWLRTKFGTRRAAQILARIEAYFESIKELTE